jgi:stage II sporulation protein M
MFLKPKVTAILLRNLNWFILALFFFVVGIITAVLAFGDERFFLTQLTESQQELLYELAQSIFEAPPLIGIMRLFLHNLFASLQMMLMGIFLGIVPLIGLFTNGALLGSIATGLATEDIPILAFMSLGILPHGIFELPAFFISSAFGMKMGFHLVFPLPQKKRWESLRYVWDEFFTLLPLILILLIAAAIIEILVTPMLIQLIIKN